MKARNSSVMLWIVAFVFTAFVTMAFVPMPLPRLQEGGPVLSEIQLVYLGIIASGLVWLLRFLVVRGYQPKKEVVAIGLYVVALVMAVLFTPVAFPAFPPFSDAPTFVTALLSWIALLLAVASPIAGMAFLIYNTLLKRVLENLHARATKALRALGPTRVGVVATRVRAKFKVVSATEHEYNGKTVKLSAIYDQSIPEDRRFAQATPTGELTMFINNPPAANAFKVGQYVYLDFTPVDAE